jgi:hypothetical protein
MNGSGACPAEPVWAVTERLLALRALLAEDAFGSNAKPKPYGLRL